MKKTVPKSISVFLAISFLISCASTNWTKQWKDNRFEGEVKKIFVVAVVRNRGPRMMMENEFVSQLKEHGIEAVGSTAVLQEDSLPTKETVAPKVREAGADTVLVVKFVKKETTLSYSPERDSGVPVTFDASMDALFQFPETTTQNLPDDFYLVTMQLTLYQVSTGKPVWSATSETKYQREGLKQIKTYTQSVLKKLVEEKLIK